MPGPPRVDQSQVTDETTPRTPQRAVSLRWRLLVLVLVPLLGFLTFAAVLVVHRVERVSAAGTAVEQVRAAVLLDDLRAAVAEEAVPVVSSVQLVDLAVGDDTTGELGDSLEGLYQEATARTDQAVLAAERHPRARAQARDAAARLAAVRASRGAGATPATRATSNSRLFDKYRYLVDALSDQVDAHLDATATADATGASDDQGSGLTQAIDDLRRTAEATTLAGEEIPLFLNLASTPVGYESGARRAFLESWAGYRRTSADVLALSAPELVSAWKAAVSTSSATFVDTALDRTVASGWAGSGAAASEGPTAGAVLQLNVEVVTRDEALHSALQTAASLAVAAAEAESATAREELAKYAIATLTLLALSVGGSLWTSRSITRPLARLAADAHAISQGRLVDVQVQGLPEARTVARGLGAAVASLRQVQAQAQAVADGDLEHAILSRPLDGPLGVVVHASVRQIIASIHDREQLQEDLTHQASHDALTALPNRVEALAEADRALQRARRTGGRVGLVFIDLDRFKAVNDSLGPAAGDAVLRAVATRLRERVRAVDVVARLGGDEFGVLVELGDDAGAERGLLALAQQLVEALSLPILLPRGGSAGEVEASVGASIGIAVAPAPHGAGTAEQLLQEADTAASRAKAAGRGRVEVYDEALRQALAAQAAVEEGLRHALVADELVLFYQPVVDLVTGRCRSVEALVRWERPGVGLVPPNDFIPVAESSDLICDLGRWALRTALTQLAAFDRDGGPCAGLSVAVNVSGRHLRSSRLLDDVTEALAASGLAPQRLTLEITETVLVEDPVAWGRLEALRAEGVRVAIDDFGTGYTSFGQLARFPVDVLKVDRSFVASDDPRTVELVRLVVGAARSFSLGVVAEGVEEHAQVRALQATGAGTAQGYLFSRPVPAAALGAAVESCPATLARCAEEFEEEFEPAG